MNSLKIQNPSSGKIEGKIALVTGGSSGIGLATAKILACHGAKVHILDIAAPEHEIAWLHAKPEFWTCDVTSWQALRKTFTSIGRLDMVFANAGVPEREHYFDDRLDDDGLLLEGPSSVIDVNLKGMLNIIKLSWYTMKKEKIQGSIVITTSATAYVPWQSLAVYSSVKLALVGLVRSLRSILICDDITINAVAPSATITKFLPQHLVEPIMATGAPVSDAHTVALALVYSATGEQSSRVEGYGKDQDADDQKSGRWNGRVILTLGDEYIELEEQYANTRSKWLGEENQSVFRMQQAATDQRRLD